MKKTTSVLTFLKMGYAVFHVFGVSSGMALGEAPPEPPLPDEMTAQASAPADGSSASLSMHQTFVSQGQIYKLQELGLQLTPPKDWEVSSGGSGPSLVMKEQRDPRPAYDEPKYQRNITMAVIHTPSPIDEKRAKELEAELVKNFSQDASIKDFKILEHKFFNFKSDNDGLLVYSTLTVGDFPIMQMHVLFSGGEKQFLFTYTDLANRFSSEQNGAYQAAWSTIVGAQIVGEAPSRLTLLRPYIVSGSLLAAICGLVVFLRIRAGRKDYKGEADSFIDSEEDFGQEWSTKTPRAVSFRGHAGKSAVSRTKDSGFGSFTSVPLSTHSAPFASLI